MYSITIQNSFARKTSRLSTRYLEALGPKSDMSDWSKETTNLTQSSLVYLCSHSAMQLSRTSSDMPAPITSASSFFQLSVVFSEQKVFQSMKIRFSCPP